MNNDSTAIESKLKRAWGRERWFHHLRGMGFLVPCLVGLFLFDLLVDWLFNLPGALRLVLMLANLAVIGWVCYRQWLTHLRRYDATRVSLQVERLHPDLNNLLVSYVQFDGDAPSAHGSPQMIQVVRAQAMKVSTALDFSGIVNFLTLRKLLIISGSVLCLFLASSVVAGEYYVILMGRMLNPFTSLTYPTRTRIEEITGPVAIKQGDKVELAARVSWEVPDQGSLHVKFGNASWEEVLIERGDKATFTQRFPKVAQSFTYYFQIGDARSERRQVKAVPSPRITSASVKLKFPSYAGRTPEEHARLHLPPILEGSEVAWELRLDQPLKEGRIHFTGNPLRSYKLSIDEADRRVARVAIDDMSPLLPESWARTSAANLGYYFEWTEAEHGFTFTDPTRYTLEVLPDKAPVVTLLKPRTGSAEDKIVSTTRKNLHVIFEVSDDYGLGKAWITYRVNNEPQVRRRPIGTFPPGAKNDLFQVQSLVKNSLPELKEGDIVTCSIEASDNRAGKAGPNLTQSPSFRLQIVNDKEYQQYVEKQVAQGLERTTAAAQEELISSKKVKSLIPEKK